MSSPTPARSIASLLNIFPMALLVTAGGAFALTGSLLDLTFLAAARSAIKSLSQSLPWWPLCWTPLVSMTIVATLRKWFPRAAGSGVPQVRVFLEQIGRADADQKNGLAPFAKLVLNGCAVGAGLEVGTMGPAAQIGAGFAHEVSRLQRITSFVARKALVLTGAGIAFALASGSAMAGVALVLEGLVVVARKTRWLVWTSLLLSGLLFVVAPPAKPIIIELSVTPLLLFISASTFGVLFAQTLLVLTSPSPRSKALRWLRARPVAAAGILGLLAAVFQAIAPGSPIGAHFYLSISPVLRAAIEAMLLFLQALASLGSGVPGGVFTPAMHIGGSVGSVFASGMSPETAKPLVAISMIAMMSALTRCPATSLFVSAAATSVSFNHPVLIMAALAASSLSARTGPSMFSIQAHRWSQQASLSPEKK